MTLPSVLHLTDYISLRKDHMSKIHSLTTTHNLYKESLRDATVFSALLTFRASLVICLGALKLMWSLNYFAACCYCFVRS